MVNHPPNMFWYDICNDYSLEVREMPDLKDVAYSLPCEQGTVFFNEHDEAIYFAGDAGLTQLDESEYAE